MPRLDLDNAARPLVCVDLHGVLDAYTGRRGEIPRRALHARIEMVAMMIERIDLDQAWSRCDPLVRQHTAVDLDTLDLVERRRNGKRRNHTCEISLDHRRNGF